MSLPKKIITLFARQSAALSLRQQLLLMFGLLFTALTLSTVFLVSSELESTSRHQADSIGNLLSAQTASAATDMLVTGDRLSLNVLLGQLVQNPYVAKAAIYSIDNREIASSESDQVGEKGETYSSPIHYQDVIAGYVRLQLDKGLLTQHPGDALTLIITVSIILLVSGLLLLYFFASGITFRLNLIERQLHSILQSPTNPVSCRNEILRLSGFVEKQLTEKLMDSVEPEPVEEEKEEVSAIVSVRNKNMPRLRQLLAPHDLMHIIETQNEALKHAAQQYQGELSYTPDGTGYIRFSSLESASFAVDALSCALLIQSLNRVVGEQNIAALEIGLGICVSDGIADFPDTEHPSQSDSAASNALMLASLPGSEGIHMFRDQLNWLPAGEPEIKISEQGEDIVEITGLPAEQQEVIQQEAYDISRELEL
ncbi:MULTISPECIES: AhpA/YtjB family protein [unclassified Endozoicomonas]|uniref:AhpA/YtjB family protein n=1 Tax=unclassified Endozoicomonas TaxID=2644528 RepID=UPI002149453C|nr:MULTISPECIES: AhpA/YtjB family protein [unclassified Endozoicomonas]